MIKKYELTDETKVVMGHTLHRIRALKSFRAGTEAHHHIGCRQFRQPFL
jgi:hypothetical protein